MACKRIYMVEEYNLGKDGMREDYEVKGVTEDLELANSIAERERDHYKDVYGMDVKSEVVMPSGRKRFKMVNEKGLEFVIRVCTTNLFS